MFFVVDGSVAVSSSSGAAATGTTGGGAAAAAAAADGDGRELARIGAGGFFGEIDVVLCQRRTARVRALEPCVLYLVSREDLDEALEASAAHARTPPPRCCDPPAPPLRSASLATLAAAHDHLSGARERDEAPSARDQC